MSEMEYGACECECGYESDGAPDVYDHRTVKIRKPHRCIECRVEYGPGARMVYESILFDGHWSHHYNCPACYQMSIDFCRSWPGELATQLFYSLGIDPYNGELNERFQ